MDIIMISALCITACIIIKLLEKESREFSFVITAGVCTLIMTLLISDLTEITDMINSLLKKIKIDSSLSEILFHNYCKRSVQRLRRGCDVLKCKNVREDNGFAFSNAALLLGDFTY